MVAKEPVITADNPARITAGIIYCLEQATYMEGHCYLPEHNLLKRVQSILLINEGIIYDHLQNREIKNLFIRHGCVYLERIYIAKKSKMTRM